MLKGGQHPENNSDGRGPEATQAADLQQYDLQEISFAKNLYRFFAEMPKESQGYIIECVRPFLTNTWEWNSSNEPKILGILEGGLANIPLEGPGRSLTVIRMLSEELLRAILVEAFREQEVPELKQRSFDLTADEAVDSPHFLTLALQNLAQDLYPNYLSVWRRTLATALLPQATQQLFLFANQSTFEEDKRKKFLDSRNSEASAQEQESLLHDLAFRTVILLFGNRDDTPRRPLTQIPAHPSDAEHFLLTCARYAAEAVVDDFYKAHRPGDFALAALKRSRDEGYALHSVGYRINWSAAQLPQVPEPPQSAAPIEPGRPNVPEQTSRLPREPVDLQKSLLLAFIKDDVYGDNFMKYVPGVIWGINLGVIISTGSFAPIAETILPLLTPSASSLSAQHILLSGACMITLHTFLRSIPTGNQSNSLWLPILAARLVSASALTNFLVFADEFFRTDILTQGWHRGAAELLTWFAYFLFETQFNAREDER